MSELDSEHLRPGGETKPIGLELPHPDEAHSPSNEIQPDSSADLAIGEARQQVERVPEADSEPDLKDLLDAANQAINLHDRLNYPKYEHAIRARELLLQALALAKNPEDIRKCQIKLMLVTEMEAKQSLVNKDLDKSSKKYVEALDWSNRAVTEATSSERAEILPHTGRILMRLGRYDEAFETLKEAEQAVRQDEPAALAEIKSFLGRLLTEPNFEGRNPHAAVTYMEDARKLYQISSDTAGERYNELYLLQKALWRSPSDWVKLPSQLARVATKMRGHFGELLSRVSDIH